MNTELKQTWRIELKRAWQTNYINSVFQGRNDEERAVLQQLKWPLHWVPGAKHSLKEEESEEGQEEAEEEGEWRKESGEDKGRNGQEGQRGHSYGLGAGPVLIAWHELFYFIPFTYKIDIENSL